MKREEEVFAASPFRFRNNGFINIITPNGREPILMKLSLPNKRQCLLTNPSRLPLLNAPQNGEDTLDMTCVAALMNSLEEVMRATEVLGETKN